MTDNETHKTISPQQQRAIRALLEYGTILVAAEAAGCRRNTVYRWMKQPEFKAELRAAENTAIEALGRGMVALGQDVLAVWREAMTSDDVPWSVRERSANNIAGHILRYRELVDLEQRIEALEQKL